MPTNYLYLTGGLGNQLFQYSALRSHDSKSNLVMDVVNGNPRTNLNKDPDIFEYKLGSDINFHKKKMPCLTQKAIGYSLRSHLEPKGIERARVWQKITRLGANVLLSLHFKKLTFIRVSTNLGDDKNFRLLSGNNYLVGYFQSVRWASNIVGSDDILRLANVPTKVQEYKALAEIEKPLVVHIRLGDYSEENSFGIPGTNYYEEALKRHLDTGNYRKIWLFSDDPQDAQQRIPLEFRDDIRIIDGSLSSANTLEVMRFGKGYVIGNSTFSLWGALLSYSRDPIVIYPHPWFNGLSAPENLVPKEWIPLNADFQST
jgi:hypothetical protein